MGISSDGILYFGFQVGEAEEKPGWMDGFDDFDDWICAKAGLPDDAPYETRKALISRCPADLELFCSYDYPMYVLALRDTEHRAHRGYIVKIGIAELSIDEGKIAVFKAWCDSNGIEWQEPSWLLCSMYG